MRIFYSIFLYLAFIACYGQSKAPLDYSDGYKWALLPGDSVSVWNELTVELPFDNVDVFYIYPTLLTKNNDKRWNYPIDDETHRQDAVNIAVRYQASAWASAGNVYVPYYRQAHIRSYDDFDIGGEEALLFAYEDVKAAFQYYLDYYNKGQAIILAGHSQGSTHLARIVKEFFDNKPLQKQLIAAYLPGIGIPKNAFDSIPLMTSPNETGGFVTWNTCKKKYDTKKYRRWYKGKAAINPVSWDTTQVVDKEQHKGFLYSNDKMYHQSFDTHLVDGAIWITTPKFPLRIMAIWTANYHAGDVNLFWQDISINAQTRARQYFLDSDN